jgi:hypothetical protein
VQFTKVQFTKVQFTKVQFTKVQFTKVQFTKVQLKQLEPARPGMPQFRIPSFVSLNLHLINPAPLATLHPLHVCVTTPRQHAFTTECFYNRISAYHASVCNGVRTLRQSLSRCEPHERRQPCYPQLLCPDQRRYLHTKTLDTQDASFHTHPAPCAMIDATTAPFPICSLSPIRAARKRGTVGMHGKRIWICQRKLKPLNLGTGGRATAEIRQLRGEAKSQTHSLLRRSDSFLGVGEVTCDSPVTEMEGEGLW